ncbi:MAG: hypothetical protein ABIR15_20040 [Chitinophagaceae bacterium]
MKALAITILFFTVFSIKNFAQDKIIAADAEKIILDNSKMRVTEFVSIAGGNVCGKNSHSHGPHLTVILTDAEVELTMPDRKKMIQKAPAGTTFWSEAETHTIKNIGKAPVRVQIIEPKS